MIDLVMYAFMQALHGEAYVGPLCDLLFLRTPLSHRHIIKRSDVLSEPFAVTHENCPESFSVPELRVALGKGTPITAETDRASGRATCRAVATATSYQGKKKKKTP